MFMTIGLIDRL